MRQWTRDACFSVCLSLCVCVGACGWCPAHHNSQQLDNPLPTTTQKGTSAVCVLCCVCYGPTATPGSFSLFFIYRNAYFLCGGPSTAHLAGTACFVPSWWAVPCCAMQQDEAVKVMKEARTKYCTHNNDCQCELHCLELLGTALPVRRR